MAQYAGSSSSSRKWNSSAYYGTYDVLTYFDGQYIHTQIDSYYKSVYNYTYIHTYIHTNIHTYIHTYIHIYLHTYIHTEVPVAGAAFGGDRPPQVSDPDNKGCASE